LEVSALTFKLFQQPFFAAEKPTICASAFWKIQKNKNFYLLITQSLTDFNHQKIHEKSSQTRKLEQSGSPERRSLS